MPFVQIDLLAGRSIEQKRALVKKVTEAISETAKCPVEAVSIIIRDLPKENVAGAGKLRLDS